MSRDAYVLLGCTRYTGRAKSEGSPSGKESGKILLVRSSAGEDEAEIKTSY